MNAILLTLIIGTLNLGLGYVLAVHLGYGPPSLAEGWEAFWADQPRGETTASQPAAAEDPGCEANGETASGGPDYLGEMASLEEMLNEPYDEPYDDEYHEPEEESDCVELELDAPENWDLDERFIEVSVLKLNIAMIRSGMRTTQIETQLRETRGKSDAETIGALTAQLVEDCEMYMAEQTEAAERFEARIGELGELSTLGEDITLANLEQTAQIETTLSNLRNMDAESDPEAANVWLLKEINRLRAARHKLRDDQETAFLAIARYENRLSKIESQLFTDPLTKLRNRIGLETTLHQWWEEGRHQSRPMSAALLDLDGFEELNQRHGSQAANRILHQLAQVLQRHSGEADLVGRFAGQRFFIMAVDVGPRAAIKSVEFIRQTIERITFLCGEEEIRVTVGGGISEVTADDTCQTLITRLGQALDEAKRAGPNRSFLHDGRRVEPVESPSLGAEYAEIPI